MRRIRIFIIGCGSIGARHARNIAGLEATEVLLFDTNSLLAEQLAQEINATAFLSVEQAISSGIDAAVIATPSHNHYEMAKYLLTFSIPVLVEKPICTTSMHAQELCELSCGHLFVVSNMRFHPALQHLRDALPLVGEPLIARSHFGNFLPAMRPGVDYRGLYVAIRSAGGGVVMDCIHEIDYLVHLFGRPVDSLSKLEKLSNLEILCEDYAHICLTHETGVHTEIHLDFIQKCKQRGCEIIGTDGTVKWRSIGKAPEYCQVEVFEAECGEWRTLFEDCDLDVNASYISLADEFLTIVRGGNRRLLSTADEGLWALQVVLDAQDLAPM